MKKVVSLISVALAVIFAMSACTVIRTPSKLVPMYNTSSSRIEWVTVNEHTTLSVRFSASTSFDGIDMLFASSFTAKVGIYAWHENLQSSVRNSEPVEEVEVSFPAGGWQTVGFDKLPKGEYVAHISDGSCDYAAGFILERTKDVRVYVNTLANSAYQPQMRIRYAYTPSVDFGNLSFTSDTLYIPEYPEQIPSADSNVVMRDVYADTYVATDALGRTLPTNETTGDVREDRFVGIFFWDWHSDNYAYRTDPGNNAEILESLKQNGLSVTDYNWSASGKPLHYWDEPIWGYYKSTDEWVLLRQAQLLANAGVDAIFFDSTNGVNLWKTEYYRVCNAFQKALDCGIDVPKLAFMLPFGDSDNGRDAIIQLYYDIYESGEYSDLWFYWEGKPLVLFDKNSMNTLKSVNKPILDFFTFRRCDSTYASGDDGWNWLSVNPQTLNYDDDGNLEQIAVSVAQNCTVTNYVAQPMSLIENVMNRAYTHKNGFSENEERDMLYGLNFQEQWDYAIENDPEFVFVTGWNEWHAINFSRDNNPVFVDQFSPLLSRDCEPSKGVLKDNYYYQLVANIRNFKGTRPARTASEAKAIDITGDLSQWSAVYPEFYAYTGDVEDRDTTIHPNYYSNTTGRNDIALAKVAHDGENLYFYVEAVDNLTPYTDNAWMRLYLDIGESEEGWEGYEYIVNRVSPTENKAYLERLNSDFTAASSAEVEYTVSGKTLQIKIPKASLGITVEEFTVNFKWSDNVQTDGDIMDFYTSGDVAPEGRFMYSYIARKG